MSCSSTFSPTRATFMETCAIRCSQSGNIVFAQADGERYGNRCCNGEYALVKEKSEVRDEGRSW